MKRNYDTGTGTNTIHLEVKTGTVGVAYTSVYLRHADGQSTKLLESDENSGNIPNSEVGQAASLKGLYVIVRTTIDFSHLNDNERDAAISTISIRYLVSGGSSGQQDFSFDPDDVTVASGKKLVIIIKSIAMI